MSLSYMPDELRDFLSNPDNVEAMAALVNLMDSHSPAVKAIKQTVARWLASKIEYATGTTTTEYVLDLCGCHPKYGVTAWYIRPRAPAPDRLWFAITEHGDVQVFTPTVPQRKAMGNRTVAKVNVDIGDRGQWRVNEWEDIP